MERDPLPVACTLEPSAVPDRLGAWRALRPELRSSRIVGGRLEAAFARGATSHLQHLVEAERSCCAWATWTLHGSDLTVEGPPDAVATLAEALLGAPP